MRNSFEISRLIENSKGWQIRQQIMMTDLSFRIYRGNTNELLDAIGKHNDVKFVLSAFSIDNREIGQATLEEAIRLFHNFVASAKSLVEHTRSVMQKILPAATFETYQARIKRDFAESALCQFVQQLRNYVLHHRTPPLASQFQIRDYGASSSSGLILQMKQLKDWDGWTSKSREFISSAKDDLRLDAVVTDYDKIVCQFYAWLGGLFEMTFKTEFDEVHRLQDELKSAFISEGVPLPKQFQ